MIASATDLSALWRGIVRKLLFAPAGELDWTAHTPSFYDNLLRCDSLDFDVDLGTDIWLTPQRFPKLTYDYLELAAYERFLDQCSVINNKASKRGSVTQMTFRVHGPRAHGNFGVKYAHGNCMIGLTYRGSSNPRVRSQPIMALHSRTSYPGYIGAADLALMYVIGKEICEHTGGDMEVQDIGFRWYVDSLQWRGMYEIPALYSMDLIPVLEDFDTYPRGEYPSIDKARREYHFFDTKDVSEMKYVIRTRFKKRFDRYHSGDPLPSIPIDSLSIDNLRRKTAREERRAA